MEEYFCPNCGATLNYQSGFDPSLGVWSCTDCGQQLMDDEVYDGDIFEGVAWYCDDCGILLNRQFGFSDSYGTWTCTECGHTNRITEDEIIDEKKLCCPNCEANLENQWGFSDYDYDWTCTECNTHLHREYTSDEFEEMEMVEENEDEDKLICPNCEANLENQWGFSDYDYDWTCNECGARLHREYTSDEFEEFEDKLVCPNCEANLKNQCGFSDYDYDWTCTECNTHLHREYISDEFEEIEVVESYEDGINYSCPVCDSNLDGQFGYNERCNDWICEYCGSKLHRYCGDYEYSVVNANKSFFENQNYNTYGHEDKDMHSYSDLKLSSRKEKSILRILRIKAFFLSRKKVPVGYSSQQLIGKNYREVEIRLYNQGFKNIHLEPQNDIYMNSTFEVGEVGCVSVNGMTSFSPQEMYSYDSEVIIFYHDKKEITVPFVLKNLRKLNYYDVQTKLSKLGFVNILVQPIRDLTIGWIKRDGSVESVSIDGDTNFKKNAVFKYDVSIMIEYHTFKNRD